VKKLQSEQAFIQQKHDNMRNQLEIHLKNSEKILINKKEEEYAALMKGYENMIKQHDLDLNLRRLQQAQKIEKGAFAITT
jgi:hypothetical protein